MAYLNLSSFVFKFSQKKHYIWLTLCNFIVFTIFCCYIFEKNAFPQESDNLDIDPYIDPNTVDEILNQGKRFNSDEAFMLGMSYGLNPVIILAPSINLSIYKNPLIIGLEFSDSDTIGIWEKERKENFGTSRFRGDSKFIKLFLGENFYIIFARENRSIDLWSRTYNRKGGKANFDMFINSSFNSFGIGFLRFSKFGFLGIDILRLNFMKKESVKIDEKWETWSTISGNRNQLNENIEERSNKWENILGSPSGFIIKIGLYY